MVDVIQPTPEGAVAFDAGKAKAGSTPGDTSLKNDTLLTPVEVGLVVEEVRDKVPQPREEVLRRATRTVAEPTPPAAEKKPPVVVAEPVGPAVQPPPTEGAGGVKVEPPSKAPPAKAAAPKRRREPGPSLNDTTVSERATRLYQGDQPEEVLKGLKKPELARVEAALSRLVKGETAPAPEPHGEFASTPEYVSAPLIETSPFILEASEITVGNLDGGVIDRFQHNANLVIGVGDAKGLVSVELERVGVEQAKIEAEKARIEGLKGEYGRRRFGFAESKAVALARKDVNTAKEAARALERRRQEFFKKRRYEDDEINRYKQWYLLESQISEGTTSLTPEMITIAQESKVDHVSDLQGLRERLRSQREANIRYQNYLKFEEGGSILLTKGKPIAIPEGGTSLKAKTASADAQLQEAIVREEEVARGLEAIKHTFPETERRLVAYKVALGKINGFVQESYVPDAEELRANLEQASDLRGERDDLNRIAELSKSRTVGLHGSVNSRLRVVAGEIRKLSTAVAEAVDPRQRLSQCPELAKGLQLVDLASREGFDASKLSPEDQMQLVLAQVLLGQTPSVDVKKPAVVRSRTVAAAPTPPSEPAAPRPPEAGAAATQPAPAEKKPLGQMTGAELQALGHEEIAAVAKELSAEQVASLDLETRLRLMREGQISDEQYSQVPEVPQIAKQVDALLNLPDDQREKALRDAFEKARDNPQALEQLGMVEEDLRARLGGAFSEEERRQPMNDDKRREALEAKTKSTDRNIVAIARVGLKALAAAGFIAMMSSTGGEER